MDRIYLNESLESSRNRLSYSNYSIYLKYPSNNWTVKWIEQLFDELKFRTLELFEGGFMLNSGTETRAL